MERDRCRIAGRGRAVALAGAICLWPAVSALAAAAGGFSDEAVERAIARGVSYLWAQQRADGSWRTTGTNFDARYAVGPTAICAYALLESGVHPNDPRMVKTLEFLEKTPAEMTYCRAFRALAYGAAVSREPKLRKLLQQDVRALILSMDREGGYTYPARGSIPAASEYSAFTGKAADQSNTQYGLLGVWAGALHDEEVPGKYWQLSLNYWLKRQFPDGGWGYSSAGRKEPYMAMTLAGLASVYVCTDNLYATKFLGCRGNTDVASIEKALGWVDGNFNAIRRQGNWFYYTLYGIERVALASGRKYLGANDWYRVGAAELLARQAGDGSWTIGGGNYSGGPCATTSYALLFLLRGRRPVLINRLEYEGDWNNRPRALANLTRWFSRQFEREVHWQVISLQAPVEEWHDAPLLCVTGSLAPKLSDEQVAKLRRFVHEGGTIFSITECAGAGFQSGIRELYQKLFPGREITQLPPGHDIYGMHYRLAGRPAFFEVSNGARPLAIHCDVDLPRTWQAGQYRTAPIYYQAAVNVVAYTNDKPALAGELRARGTSPWPPPRKGASRLTVSVARLKHAANCDPEPLAYERFGRLLARRERIGLNVLGPIEIARLPESGAKRAVLTGTGKLTLSDAEKATLTAWLGAGGRLLIDAAGGDKDFAESAEAIVEEMLGRRSARTLSGTAGLYNVKGFEIERVNYRRNLREVLGESAGPRVRAVLRDGQAVAYLSGDDITCGLVGYPSYTVRGYTPETAYELVRNFLLEGVGTAAGGAVGPATKPAGPASRQASASRRSDQAGKAVDGDPATKWDTGGPMQAGDWLAVDLGAFVRVRKITLDTRGSPQEHPRGFRMYLSPDGKRWGKSALESKGGATLTAVGFSNKPRVRYIKFELTNGHDTLPWSVHEVRVETEEP